MEESSFIQRICLSILCARRCGEDKDEQSKFCTRSERKGQEGGHGREEERSMEKRGPGMTSLNSHFRRPAPPRTFLVWRRMECRPPNHSGNSTPTTCPLQAHKASGLHPPIQSPALAPWNTLCSKATERLVPAALRPTSLLWLSLFCYQVYNHEKSLTHGLFYLKG